MTSPVPPLSIFTELFGDDFFYVNYHNEPGGIAEAEYDADPAGLLGGLFASPDQPRAAPLVTDPERAAGGWIPRLGVPHELPTWLTPDEFAEMVAAFERSGFRGGINYYRNFDRNWELSAPFADTKLSMPVSFIAGAEDMVVGGQSAVDLESVMGQTCADLRSVHLIPGSGHWVQQETPETVSRLLLDFLGGI